MKTMCVIACVGAVVGLAQAQTYVMGVASTNDAVHLFDATTGALFQQNFIDLSAVGASTPKHAMQVGNQIWVSDQIEDKIFRFDLTGAFMGEITGALDNIKGMEVVGDKVWVTNAGTNNGASGNSIVFIDTTTYSVTGSATTVGSLFDLINYNGQVLGSNITNESIEVYDSSGVLVETFVSSDGVTGIDFPQQLFARGNGNVLAAGFSGPSGIYEYDVFGNSLGVVAGLDSGARGVLELLSGDIMWTDGGGFFVGNDEVFAGGAGQYLSFVTIPAPGAVALLGMGGLVGLRRRR